MCPTELSGKPHGLPEARSTEVDTRAMKTINRMAAVVSPKKPFFDWSEDVLGPDENDCDAATFRSVFLLPERTRIENALKSVYADIFDEMLRGSVSDPQYWPDKRDLRTFRAWFEVTLVEMVYDPTEDELLHDLD